MSDFKQTRLSSSSHQCPIKVSLVSCEVCFTQRNDPNGPCSVFSLKLYRYREKDWYLLVVIVRYKLNSRRVFCFRFHGHRLKCFGDAPGCSGASYVLPGIFVAQMLTMPFGPYFQGKIGCQVLIAPLPLFLNLSLLVQTVAPLPRPTEYSMLLISKRFPLKFYRVSQI